MQNGGNVGDALAQLLSPLRGTTVHSGVPLPDDPMDGSAEDMQLDRAEGGSSGLSGSCGSGSLGARSHSVHSLGDSTARSTGSSGAASQHYQHGNSTASNNENACAADGTISGAAAAGGETEVNAAAPVLVRMSTRSKLPVAPIVRPQVEGLIDRTNSMNQ